MSLRDWWSRLRGRPVKATDEVSEPDDLDREIDVLVAEELRRRPIPTHTIPPWNVDSARIPMPGWEFLQQTDDSATWRDAEGDVISLNLQPPDQLFPDVGDEGAVRGYARIMTEGQRAGLIEAAVSRSDDEKRMTYVYKKLEKPAFKFYGVIVMPFSKGTWIWMVFAPERGTTGVREALITERLFNSGQLTIESYKATWAKDPYDPGYRGVPRETLRYRSDAEEFDADFPNHPLSKVRRELRRLLAIRIADYALLS